MFERQERKLKVNGSGVYDPTAYKAIKGMEGYEMTNDTYRDGDVVKVEKFNGTTEEMLLIKCHGAYAASVILRETPPMENPIPVMGSQKMYTDGARLGYTYYDTITGLVRTLTDAELNRVKRGIGKALGIEPNEPKEKHEEKPEEKPGSDIEAMLKGVSDGVEVIGEAVLKLTQMADEPDARRLVYLEAERDIYKKLWEEARA